VSNLSFNAANYELEIVVSSLFIWILLSPKPNYPLAWLQDGLTLALPFDTVPCFKHHLVSSAVQLEAEHLAINWVEPNYYAADFWVFRLNVALDALAIHVHAAWHVVAEDKVELHVRYCIDDADQVVAIVELLLRRELDVPLAVVVRVGQRHSCLKGLWSAQTLGFGLELSGELWQVRLRVLHFIEGVVDLVDLLHELGVGVDREVVTKILAEVHLTLLQLLQLLNHEVFFALNNSIELGKLFNSRFAKLQLGIHDIFGLLFAHYGIDLYLVVWKHSWDQSRDQLMRFYLQDLLLLRRA
jgi:hypothetical protein